MGAEAFAINGAVEQVGRIDAVIAQGGKKRSLPAAMRKLIDEALSFRCPAAQPGHVGFRPGLVDEHQSPGIDAALIGSPARAMAAYVRAVLLARVKRLFLNVTPRRRKKQLIIEVSDLTPRSHKRRSHSAESGLIVRLPEWEANCSSRASTSVRASTNVRLVPCQQRMKVGSNSRPPRVPSPPPKRKKKTAWRDSI
jgi:hypothetical protein